MWQCAGLRAVVVDELHALEGGKRGEEILVTPRDGEESALPAHGVAAVVLKRLDDAVADGDAIYAVIKATATWDPTSLADGAGVTSSSFTVTGAVFGDTVSFAASF